MIAIRFPGIEDYIIQKQNYMSNKKIGNITPTFGDIYLQNGIVHCRKLLHGMVPNDNTWIWEFYNNFNS